METFKTERSALKAIGNDRTEPASQIKAPPAGSWQNKDFLARVLDEDLESDIDSDRCAYKIFSYDEEGREHSSGWQWRKCNSDVLVSVGPDKWCGHQGRDACWVYLFSRDKAGNEHSPGQEKGSIKSYNIDWSPPEAGRVSVDGGAVRANVRDNLKVAGCSFYFDGKDSGVMSFVVPGCQTECQAEKDWQVKLEPGSHIVRALCRDAAANAGWGEELSLKENQPPQIISCRVQPSQGEKTLTDFQFSLEAADPDGDGLSFFWDFGDGRHSGEDNPRHSYNTGGTFEPKVMVSDGKGGQDICSTAWVVVL